MFGDSLLVSRKGVVIPEATSPFMTRSPSSAEGISENFGNSSIASGGFTTSGGLYVENMRTLPRAPPITATQGAYLANSKVFISAGMGGRIKSAGANDLYDNTSATRFSNQILTGASSAFPDPSKSTNQGITVAHGLIGTAQSHLLLPSQAPEIPPTE